MSMHSQKCHKLYIPPDYSLEEILGSGSFSEVHKAETGSVIALKMFRKKMNLTSQYKTAAKEIAFLKIFKHPNILELRIYEIDRRYVYIGTEFAAYKCLTDYLKDRLPTPEPIIKFIMRQIISPLCYLHEMGIFHGDIKPDNIMCMNLTDTGPIVKIGDFGLSEIRLKGGEKEKFLSGSFIYMAPEVHLKYPVDCTSDLWSAGIIMYTMMFNRNIFSISDNDRQKQIAYFKRRISPNWFGEMAYSIECNNLLRNLLAYDKQNRLTGQALCSHTFLTIPNPIIPAPDDFLNSAQESINAAISYYEEKKYGEALVEGTKAVMNLKIHYNLTEVPTETPKANNQPHWETYEDFNNEIVKVLVEPDRLKYRGPDICTESELRLHLKSTPRMLDGYDIGCSAEMFYKEGKKDRALSLFHQALQVLMPLMKTEPMSNRKNLLGRRLKKWIDYVEHLEPQPSSSGKASSSYVNSSDSVIYVPQ